MSTKIEKRLEKVDKLLERLKARSARGVPIVVEGINDVNALHRLGISGDIILTKTSGKSFLDVLTEIENRKKPEVILLLDFDRPGKEWTMRLSSCLERMKITPNMLFWRTLHGLVGRDVKDIEGLATYLDNLRAKRLMS